MVGSVILKLLCTRCYIACTALNIAFALAEKLFWLTTFQKVANSTKTRALVFSQARNFIILNHFRKLCKHLQSPLLYP